MAKDKLRDSQVRAASKPGLLGDGDGLYLRVSAAGRKSWVFIFIRQGKRREMGLGAYGSGTGQVSLSLAREKAGKARRILGAGGDPFTDMAERQRRSEIKTFGQVADALLEAKAESFRNEKHKDQWAMTLGDAYCARLRKIPVADVTTDDVIAVLQPHWLDKHETASRLRGRIEKVLDFARAKGWREGDNPARWKGNVEVHLPKPAQPMARGHHAAMPYVDVPAFAAELRLQKGISPKALEFLMLTAARTGEVLGATWDEIDMEAGIWTVPGRRMKAGRTHRVPLSNEALSVLRWAAEHRSGAIVFPGQKKDRPLSNMAMTKVMRSMERGDFTVHGFRSAFRDWVSEQTNFPDAIAEAALAHIVGDLTERAYRRGALSKKGAS